jgi:hypothetical protein
VNLRVAVETHRRALFVIALAALLDALLGVAFAFAQHVSVGNGLYFATVTGTTVGYGDITPHGWESHLCAVAMMVLVIPLFGASFSLFTSGLSAIHLKVRLKKGDDAALAAHKIMSDLYQQQTGEAHPLAAQ